MTFVFDQRLKCSQAAAANPHPIVENRESETTARESPDRANRSAPERPGEKDHQ
jgi:hypothetical protein